MSEILINEVILNVSWILAVVLLINSNFRIQFSVTSSVFNIHTYCMVKPLLSNVKVNFTEF
jgi:hypothetical protein